MNLWDNADPALGVALSDDENAILLKILQEENHTLRVRNEALVQLLRDSVRDYWTLTDPDAAGYYVVKRVEEFLEEIDTPRQEPNDD